MDNIGVKVKKVVLDACSVIRGSHDFSSRPYLLPQKAFLEVGDCLALDALEAGIESGSVTVKSAGEKSMARVRVAAEKTGDAGSLSEADVEVIAVALEEGAVIETDDYAVQNVASVMGLEYVPCVQDGISSERFYSYFCPGCGRDFTRQTRECPVCASTVKRRVKSG